jgi:integrase
MREYAPSTVNRHIAIIKAMFHYGLDFELIDRMPNVRKALAKVPMKKQREYKTAKKRTNGEPLFTAHELKAIIEAASLQIRAMTLLGINGGFGNTDCAQLRSGDIDFKRGLIDYCRVKTGIRRTVPLWPETLAALQAVLSSSRPIPRTEADRELVFLTRFGRSWVWTAPKDVTSGQGPQIRKNDEVAKQFTKLVKQLKLKRPGLGFYSLRHTHATLADRARDIHAQKRIMGHAIPGMLGEYVEDIDLDRLRAVVDVVRTAIFGEHIKNDSQQVNSEPTKA